MELIKRVLITGLLVTVACWFLPAQGSTQPRGKRDDHGWVCTLSGTVVGAGVGAAAAPITGVLAGGAWTAGCELGQSKDDPPQIIDGLPVPHHKSFYEMHWLHRWWHWKHKHGQDHGHKWWHHERHWLSKHPRWKHKRHRPIYHHVFYV